MTIPIYLISPAGAGADAHLAALGDGVERFESADALGEMTDRVPGLVLADRGGVSDAELIELAERVGAGGEGWVLAAIDSGPTPTLRTLSFGPPASLVDAAEYAGRRNGSNGALLELRGVLAEVAKARHDLNNPLTSALAEVQLLLLDADDEESRESLSIVQAQLRRMRDLIAEMSHLRPPKSLRR